MKWIQTTIGVKAHVVLDGEAETLCGIALTHAIGIVVPGPEDRCENCDHLWRKQGRDAIRWMKKQQQRKPPSGYRPRFRYRDWERSND